MFRSHLQGVQLDRDRSCTPLAPRQIEGPLGRGFQMIKEFVSDERGQDVVEYSLLLVLIGTVALFVLTLMGTSISEIFSKISDRLSEADNRVS